VQPSENVKAIHAGHFEVQQQHAGEREFGAVGEQPDASEVINGFETIVNDLDWISDTALF
jgi:hypothetical protein